MVFSYLISRSFARGNQNFRIRRYFACWGGFFFRRSLPFFFVPTNMPGGGQGGKEERCYAQYEN
jgi:hypothetical protein